MRPRILLIGSDGQVGRALSHSLTRVGDVTALVRAQLDLGKPDEIRRVVRSLRPELIVNAAAYTAVDRAESEPDLAQAINADAPRIIAETGKEIGAALVHYSTDYVFDGSKATSYVESGCARPSQCLWENEAGRRTRDSTNGYAAPDFSNGMGLLSPRPELCAHDSAISHRAGRTAHRAGPNRRAHFEFVHRRSDGERSGTSLRTQRSHRIVLGRQRDLPHDGWGRNQLV